MVDLLSETWTLLSGLSWKMTTLFGQFPASFGEIGTKWAKSAFSLFSTQAFERKFIQHNLVQNNIISPDTHTDWALLFNSSKTTNARRKCLQGSDYLSQWLHFRLHRLMNGSENRFNNWGTKKGMHINNQALSYQCLFRKCIITRLRINMTNNS